MIRSTIKEAKKMDLITLNLSPYN